MKQLFIPYYILLIFGLLITGSCKETKDEPVPPVRSDVGRTVLVYMASDNNLGSSHYDRSDIEEMMFGAAESDLGVDSRLIVYHSAYREAPVLMEILPDRIDTLRRYEYGIEASQRARMEDVIASTRQMAPAKNYGLVLWGHGTGWLQDGITPDSETYAYGPENGKSMNITTLAEVLEAAGCFDYIYFDCCYMSSAETVYQLRNSADYIIGSATELITTGMPYDVNLPLLMDGSKESLIAAARNTFDYYNAFSGNRRTCTMSVIETSRMPRLAQAAASVYALASWYKPDGYTPQRLSDYDVRKCYYFDLKDYVHAMIEADDMPESVKTEFDNAFNEAVIYSAATPRLWESVDLSRCNGLSTYIMTNSLDFEVKNYYTLQWYSDVASSFDIEPK